MVFLQRLLWLAVVPLAVGGAFAWWGTPRELLPSSKPSAAPDDPSKKETTLPASKIELVGSASCSARGCHGALHTQSSSSDPDKCLQNEYIQWSRDRHADAYSVLFEKRSQRIMELLNHGTASKTLAHEDPRCLACHTNPSLASIPEEQRPRHDEKLFGVGCESCHGAAGKWLVPHTDKSWRKVEKKWEDYGMVPVTDPVHLVQTCVGCHVGARPNSAKKLPLQDVNHDLIAAGHPRLNFEFGSFLANMPPHWRNRKKQEGEGQIWAVGQLVSAQAALDLLSERAGDDKKPWPEFAEYDCYSCHHSLAQPSWRQKPGSRRPGSLSWGSWYYPLLPDSAGMNELATNMQKPLPDRKKAQEQARAAFERLQGQHKVFLQWKNGEIFDYLKKVALQVEPNWDSAEQLYLGLSAVNLSHPDKATTKLLLELTPVREFSPGFDSPASWKTNGRPAFDPDDFFRKLRSAYKPNP